MFDAIALGSGLVGEFVINELTKLGYQVHVIDLKIPENVKNNPQVSFQEGDVFDLLSQMPEAKIAVNMLIWHLLNKTRANIIHWPKKTLLR
jgi:nucleoside-diphosphate-sugar epimerase